MYRIYWITKWIYYRDTRTTTVPYRVVQHKQATWPAFPGHLLFLLDWFELPFSLSGSFPSWGVEGSFSHLYTSSKFTCFSSLFETPLRHAMFSAFLLHNLSLLWNNLIHLYCPKIYFLMWQSLKINLAVIFLSYSCGKFKTESISRLLGTLSWGALRAQAHKSVRGSKNSGLVRWR